MVRALLRELNTAILIYNLSVETSLNTLLKLFSDLLCSFNSGLVWINEDDRLSSESISYKNYLVNTINLLINNSLILIIFPLILFLCNCD